MCQHVCLRPGFTSQSSLSHLLYLLLICKKKKSFQTEWSCKRTCHHDDARAVTLQCKIFRGQTRWKQVCRLPHFLMSGMLPCELWTRENWVIYHLRSSLNAYPLVPLIVSILPLYFGLNNLILLHSYILMLQALQSCRSACCYSYTLLGQIFTDRRTLTWALSGTPQLSC